MTGSAVGQDTDLVRVQLAGKVFKDIIPFRCFNPTTETNRRTLLPFGVKQRLKARLSNRTQTTRIHWVIR